jgi:magnesium chelatase family protein
MRVFSLLAEGISTGAVEIEFHSRFQIPSFSILGLPAPEIQEARERIMAAFQAVDLEFPKKKVIINLAPASVRKSGTGHDLSIAVKIVSEILDHTWPETLLAWGELSLEGKVKPVGKMANLIEILLQHLPKERVYLLLTPQDFERFQSLWNWRKKMKLIVPRNLDIQIIEDLQDLNEELKPTTLQLEDEDSVHLEDHSNLSEGLLPLSPRAERVLKLSLIGKHHVLLLGPKGIGKSESIRWYQALLPESPPAQTWQRILISENRDLPLDFSAPVRRVHSQVKPAHLLGSFRDKGYQPGELALAHGGLFVADEFMEWPRDAKESLREPLQSKKIFLTRVKGHMECPTDFQMIATGNLCPCGGLPPVFRGDAPRKKFPCRCRNGEVEHYMGKLSGPVLDRIDLAFVMHETERQKPDAEIFLRFQKEIRVARAFALKEFGAIPSELTPQWLDENMPEPARMEKLLSDVVSLRSRHKILRVARSIQALERKNQLLDEHIFEAKWYRFQTHMHE